MRGVVRCATMSIYRPESLDSPAPVCLGYIYIPFGIDRQSMSVGKRAGLVTWLRATDDHKYAHEAEENANPCEDSSVFFHFTSRIGPSPRWVVFATNESLVPGFSTTYARRHG